jgi:hypothetical protein
MSDHQDPSTDAPIDNRRSLEFSLLHDAALKIAHMYLTWFTWALGLNILVLAALFAKGDLPNPVLATAVGMIMILGSGLAIGAGIQQAKYYGRTVERAVWLNPFGADRVAVELLFAKPIFIYVCWVIPMMHFSIFVGWAVFIRKYGGSPWLLISN